MSNSESSPSPRKGIAGLLRRNVYWFFITAILLAIIIFQANWRHRALIRPPIKFSPPAYGRVQVSLKAGEYPLQALLDEAATQSHIHIHSIWNTEAKSTNLDPKKLMTIPGQPWTLQEILEHLVATTGLTVDYEPSQIVVGDDEATHSRARTIQVAYPVGDLLLIDDPLSSGASHIERLESLQSLIISMVEPEQWRDNGGVAGSIRSLDDKLYIVATPAMHLKIEELLAAVRAK